MYTKCPECRTAFRLTVSVLRQAHGRVRCGGCGHGFDALDYLHDDKSGKIRRHAAEHGVGDQSRSLLDTLDELAGPDDVRIEDTGIEWRVFETGDETDEDANERAADAAGSESGATIADRDHASARGDDAAAGEASAEPDAESGDAGGEPERPDGSAETHNEDDATSIPAGENDVRPPADDTRDWTLHDDKEESPDHRGERGERGAIDDAGQGDEAREPTLVDDRQAALDLGREHGEADDMRYDDDTPLADDDVWSPMPATPRRRIEDIEPDASGNEWQADLALSDPDDWQTLLDEMGTVAAGSTPADTAQARSDQTDNTGESGVGAAAIATDRRIADPADDARAMSADAGDDTPQAAEQELEAALTDAVTDDASLPGPRDAAKPRPAAGRDEKSPGFVERRAESASGLFESIVMEGDTVRSGTDEDDADYHALARAAAGDTKVAPGSPAVNAVVRLLPRRPEWIGSAAAAALGLLLAMQLVHANRASLATNGAVQRTLGPVYRLFGSPLTPAWNVRGWQFEATNGSTDVNNERLTIQSRIANKSEQSLPYPLLHVSLTDRFEEVIGSRVLTPDEYLPGNVDPAPPVTPGQDFTAVIPIDTPSDDATGFKLNVCYRLQAGRLRCAIDTFKN